MIAEFISDEARNLEDNVKILYCLCPPTGGTERGIKAKDEVSPCAKG